MAWWGVVLIGFGCGMVGFIGAAILAAGGWSDAMHEQGYRYHKELEAERAKVAKFRDAHLRACARAAGYRAEINRIRREGCGPRCAERAVLEAEEREADRS